MGLFSRRKSKDLPSPPAGPPAVPVDTKPEQACLPPPPQHAPQIPGLTGQNASSPAFQPPGYPGSPPGWTAGPPPPAYPQHQAQQVPIVVNQHYYLIQAPQKNPPPGSAANACALTKLVVGSAVNLTNQVMPGLVVPALFTDEDGSGSRGSGAGSSVTSHMSQRFTDLMTLIDCDRFSGHEKDLFTCPFRSRPSAAGDDTQEQMRGNPKTHEPPRRGGDQHSRLQTADVAATVISGNYFAKVELYANARLPMDLPPLKLYIPTWPLVCLAARYAERVYEKPRGKEKDVQVDADARSGTKAMVIKSVPMDDMNTIVFAIRGTASFADWTVNLNTEPISPVGFLDDYGNYCHAGFLSVARRMIAPVAARLRQLLRENPARSACSLLITGHSAGGAVAALLYAHMVSSGSAAGSELRALTGSFKRVHCVTFGTPPVSLLPLQRPPELRKSLFLSFVNEGDPVARADKAYVRSLLELFATPVPVAAGSSSSEFHALSLAGPAARSKGSLVSSSARSGARAHKLTKSPKGGGGSSSADLPHRGGPVWEVPPCTLSNAGRIVVLRSGDARARLKGKKTVEERLNEGVVAQVASDEQLRTQVWGDPVCHLMKLYSGRLEILAVNAVTAKGY